MKLFKNKKERNKINNKIIIFIMIIVLIVILIIGMFIKSIATNNKKTPISLTNNYYKDYTLLSKKVINKIKYPFDDKLSKDQLEKYKNIMKFQYRELEYTIVSKKIEEVTATVKTKIEVVDLNSCYEKANSYIISHNDEFKGNEIDYKLEQLDKCSEKVTYSIEFSFYKNKDEWKMEDLNGSDLSKINGTF